MASPLPVVPFRAFDANGNPLAGGKVYTYQAGTNTPLASYTDQTGLVANTNPVILDANGEANIWLVGIYKINLTDSAGVNQPNYPQDNIYDIANQIGNSFGNIQNIYAGTSAGSANVITLAPSPALTTIPVGMKIRFLVFQDNTGGVTLNVSGLGALPVRKFNGSVIVALSPQDLKANTIAEISYDGTQWELINSRPFSKANAIPGAGTLNLDATNGIYAPITGAIAITAVTLSLGQYRILRFDGVTTITNGANLILPSGANITTAIGDIAVLVGEEMGVVRVVNYYRATGLPLALPPATTFQRLTSGIAATYTTPANCRAILVKMVAGGGGGGAVSANAGSTGGTTTFNSVTAIGGSGGVIAGNTATSASGGTGGTGTATLRIPGQAGTVSYVAGGNGGSSILGLGGVGGNTASPAGQNASVNSGAGGGGASSNSGSVTTASGGGGGEYVEIYISSPAASYTYTVGTAGTGGAAGTFAGGNGGTGYIMVTEYY